MIPLLLAACGSEPEPQPTPNTSESADSSAINIGCLVDKGGGTPHEKVLVEIGSLDSNVRDIGEEDFQLAQERGLFERYRVPPDVTRSFSRFTTSVEKMLNNFCDVPKGVWMTQVSGKKKVRFIPQMHGVSRENSKDRKKTAEIQLKILHELKKANAKVIVSEGVSKPLTSEQAQSPGYKFENNSWRNATDVVESAVLADLFSGYETIIPRELTHEQVEHLNAFSATEVYISIEQGVTLLPAETAQQEKQIEQRILELVNPVLEAAKQKGMPFEPMSYNSAMNYLYQYDRGKLADFKQRLDYILHDLREEYATEAVHRAVKAHPDHTVYLIYGAAHVFCDDVKQNGEFGLEAIRLMDDKTINFYFRQCEE